MTASTKTTAPTPPRALAPDAAGRELFALANSLAHEIRNPLHALSLNLNLLARDIGTGPAASTIAAAQREVGRLDELLTTFLRFARPKTPRPAAVDVRELLGEVEVFIAPEAAKHGVDLNFQTPAGLTVTTDGNLLKQALLNVILNSFEAGAGRVEVLAAAADGRVYITVRDDGPGFAEPARAFEPFYSTKPDGSGLGLAISRAIAIALDGELRVDAPAAGAEVTLTIPRRAPQSKRAPTVAEGG